MRLSVIYHAMFLTVLYLQVSEWLLLNAKWNQENIGEIKKKVVVDTAKCPRKIEHGVVSDLL